MVYVGLDVHEAQSTFCVLDSNGKKTDLRTVHGRWPMVIAMLEKYKGQCGQEMELCFEATCGYGYLYEALSKFCKRVMVADPSQLRLIFASKRKTDRLDAERLAKLVFLGEVPAVHVPSGEVRQWRELIVCREHLIRQRGAAKNTLRSQLRANAIQAPRGLWSATGREWLKQVEFPSCGDSFRRDATMVRLAVLEDQIKEIDKYLGTVASRHPAVAVLDKVPGVGIRTAEAFVAYVDDPGRFSSIKQVGSYFGFIPSQDQSGKKERFGRVTRRGSPIVRRLMTEAAWQAVRRSPEIRSLYQRIRRDDPARTKKAIIAVAHHLARVMLALLRTGETYRATPA